MGRSSISVGNNSNKKILILLVLFAIFSTLVSVVFFLSLQVYASTNSHQLFHAQQPRTNNQELTSHELTLLTTPSVCNISTDVRGNLGPAKVMLTNGTNWLKDRWQAASNMHGKAIQGTHWVKLDFEKPIQLFIVVLDWEAAFSDRYRFQYMDDAYGEYRDVSAVPGSKIQQAISGQSPGVKTKTPLHVLHLHKLQNPVTAKSFRLLIEHSAMGWGVSLWQIKFFGHFM